MAKSPKSTKIDLSAAASPLAADPFAALSALDAASLRAAPEAAPAPPVPVREAKKGRLLLRREKKERGGKTVVVASGFASEGEAEDVLRSLRKALGCGGAVEDGNEVVQIVLQGDRPAAVAEALRGLGYPVGGVVS